MEHSIKQKQTQPIHTLLTSKYCGLFSIPLLLTGCVVVGPDYVPPQDTTPKTFSEPVGSTGEISTTALADGGHWWSLFNDSELDKLIELANTNNRSLKAAYKRWEQAETLINRERSEGLPQFNSESSYARSHPSDSRFNGRGETFSTFQSAVTAGWEIDFFGRVKRLVNAAQADADAQKEALIDLRLLIQTDVASTYFTVRQLAYEINLIEQSIETREESLRIVNARFESGTVSDLDVAQAQTLLATAQADLATLQRQKAIAQNTLAVLCGQAASDFAFNVVPLEGQPLLIDAGLPGELLRRRPDIRQAERLVAAASERIGVAQAAFFPKVVIGGDVGFSSNQLTHFGEANSGFWGLGPNVSIPIFQGGRLRANLKQNELAYLESIENYQQTVLLAIAEVEDAIQSIRYLKQQRNAITAGVEASQRARDISLQQYSNGVIDFITALDAERSMLTNKQLLSRVIGEEYINSVRLIRSIGGQW